MIGEDEAETDPRRRLSRTRGFGSEGGPLVAGTRDAAPGSSGRGSRRVGESTAEKVPMKWAAPCWVRAVTQWALDITVTIPEDGSGKRPATRSFLSTSCSHLRAKPSLPLLTTFVSIRLSCLGLTQCVPGLSKS